MKQNRNVNLSQTDLIFHAMEEVTASFGMLVTLRFKNAHPEEEMKRAMRYMLTIYPKLRSILKPTFFSYRLKLFEDGESQLETLFNQAFRVIYIDPDSKDYFEIRRLLFNEPFALTQGLPIRIRYLPNSDRPVLLISIHHMTCDGIGFMHMVESLMAYLNGERPPVFPLDNRSIWLKLLKKPYHKIPVRLYASFKKYQATALKLKHHRIVNISPRPANYFGTANIIQHNSEHELSTILKKSKEYRVSLTTFVMTALVRTISKHKNNKDGDTIGIFTAIGLRQLFEKEPPVFGNYVKGNLVHINEAIWNHPQQIMKEIKHQLRDRVEEVKKKEFMYPWLKDRILVSLGKKNMGRGIVNAKKKGNLEFTCQLSTGGNIDKINSHGTKARVIELLDAVPHHKLFITLTSLNGKINMNFSYPEAEYTRTDVQQFISLFDEELGNLMA